jgi:predicted nicotinamide N-methyase
MPMPIQATNQPFLTDTPLDAVRATQREVVIVDGRKFLIDRPIDSDKLLDHPAIQEANAADDYVPYWPEIWPAARMLAKAVLREEWACFNGRPLEALEIGCGLGVAGVAALARGLGVIFSDYDRTALHFAAANARLNGFADFQTLALDWRHPPADLKVPVVLGADLLYEERNVDPIVSLIQRVLLPGGVCLLTDPDRNPSARFRARLGESRLRFSVESIRAGEPGGKRVKGTLYRIFGS